MTFFSTTGRKYPSAIGRLYKAIVLHLQLTATGFTVTLKLCLDPASGSTYATGFARVSLKVCLVWKEASFLTEASRFAADTSSSIAVIAGSRLTGFLGINRIETREVKACK